MESDRHTAAFGGRKFRMQSKMSSGNSSNIFLLVVEFLVFVRARALLDFLFLGAMFDENYNMEAVCECDSFDF